VLPALVPELNYDSLPIADGESASLELLRFNEEKLEPEVRERLRSAFLRYCAQDTWGLARLLEYLRQLAKV
jgi:hypothetical protein